jgi:hypothetical protein
LVRRLTPRRFGMMMDLSRAYLIEWLFTTLLSAVPEFAPCPDDMTLHFRRTFVL